MDDVETFCIRFLDKVIELELCLIQVYRADESGLFWKILPKKTLSL